MEAMRPSSRPGEHNLLPNTDREQNVRRFNPFNTNPFKNALLEDFHDQVNRAASTDLRSDRKLFHTSTTTISGEKLHRTLSNLSGSLGSRCNSQSSLSSNYVATSNGTISSTNSTSHYACESSATTMSYNHPQRRTSNSVEEGEGVGDKSFMIVASTSKRSPRSSNSSDLAQCDVTRIARESDHVHEVKAVNTRPGRTKAKKSAFATAAAVHASCPSLNDPQNYQGQGTHWGRKADVSGSVMNIGPQGNKNRGQSLGTSMSSACLSLLHIRSLQSNLKRPVTLRFAPSGLTESSRVVWMSDDGNHTGTVRWVGKIRDQYYAGVEFEKPIGNSSGIYGYGYGLQVRLFTCKLGYGRFVPVSELILYEDFYENQKTGFICIICRDDFLEPGQPDDLNNRQKLMVATKCGHLFHQTCLNQWFSEKPVTLQQCPYCQLPMKTSDTIRIFPAQLK